MLYGDTRNKFSLNHVRVFHEVLRRFIENVGTLFGLRSDKIQLGVLGVKFDFIEGGGLTPSQRVSSFEDRSVSVPCLAFVYIGRM